jgi:hypothetical protein
MAELVILPAVALGALLGVYEMILIHRDVQVPTHRFGHGVHAFIFAIVGTFISFNVPLVFSVFPTLATIPVIGTLWGIRLIISIIMAIKIHGVSAALKTSGMSSMGLGETWTHSLLIGLLTGFAPYLYPFIADAMPSWFK